MPGMKPSICDFGKQERRFSIVAVNALAALVPLLGFH
jgi:hypothetical protein